MSSLAAALPDNVVIWLPRLVSALFLFAFGGCVGSFLNVVVYRVPDGRSVVTPPSRCPRCGAMLPWHDNLPVIGWLLLRGRCRRCRSRISVQYPLIELLVGLLFAGTYLVLFAPNADTTWAEIGGAWWRRAGLGGAWPAYGVLMAMVSGLLAATLVDARTFLIPGGITTTMTLFAFGGWLLQAIVGGPGIDGASTGGPLPEIGWVPIGVALGGWLGVAVANFGLATGRIPRSFADYEEYVPEGETLAEYPHGRREMGKELLFLAPILVGGLLGGWLLSAWSPASDPAPWLELLASAGLGWLVGGGVVWAVRILGTLAFGREAMGMGDVHLLAAIGAALGWIDPIRIFFMAPFIALAWIAVTRVIASIAGRPGHELPYGPHLAAATVVLVYGRPWLEQAERFILLPPG